MTTEVISHHHGTCNMCNKRNVIICMFGYNAHGISDVSYSICKNCMHDHIQQILYGFHTYKDGLID